MEPLKSLPHHSENWQGYTLEDLRYRRAYIAACRELEKERLLHTFSSLRMHPATGAFNIAAKVAGRMPTLNRILFFVGIGAKLWNLIGKFRGKKKKR